MEKKKPIAILRTKSQILTARDVNNIQIADEVLKDPQFITAKMTDLLGLKVIEGSDFKVIECKNVQNDPETFFDFMFGESETNETNMSTDNN